LRTCGLCTLSYRLHSSFYHEGNTEEESNGYVVFFNEMPTDQLGNRVVMRGEELLRPPPPLSTAGFNQIFKRRRERFFSTFVIIPIID
jgi:hypothetical protein